MSELLFRAAGLTATTFKRAEGTVELILSAGSPVDRGAYTEILDTSPAAWTAPERVPLLDSHNRSSVDAILGSVTNIAADRGLITGLATITRELVLSLIERGAAPAVSIGYRVGEWRNSADGRQRTAAKWSIAEVSLTSMPADPAARLRSEGMEHLTTLRTTATGLGLPATFIDELLGRADLTLEAGNAAILAELRRREVRIPPARQTGPSGDDPSILRGRMAEALASRMGTPGDISEPAREFRGIGLHAMLRSLLSAQGERGLLTLSAEQLCIRAVATSDLPELLTSAGQRRLRAAYDLAPRPLFALAVASTADDFRAKSALQFDLTGGTLPRVPEGAEITYGGAVETKASYSISTFARIFAVTRQALINDDLDAFGQMSALQGRQARETANKALTDLLLANAGLGPVMSDGATLFHASHGNVAATAGAPDPDTLADGVLAMRLQRGLDGVSPINIAPRTLLASPGEETAARQSVAAFYPATAAEVNPLTGAFSVAIEGRLGTGTRWYLFADPAAAPVFEYSYLSSAPGPQMDSRPGWNVLGMEFRVFLDFGAGALDWRGAYTNAGA